MKISKRIVLLLIALCLFCGCSKKEETKYSNIKVYGVVFDRYTYEPKQGVQVSVWSALNRIEGSGSLSFGPYSIVGSAYTGSDGSYEINFSRLDYECNSESDWARYSWSHRIKAGNVEQDISLTDGSNNVDLAI